MTKIEKLLLRLVSTRKRAWIRAAFAESEQIEDEAARQQWRNTARVMLIRHAVLLPALKLMSTGVAISTVAFLNRASSDDAGKAVMLSIIVLSAALGAVWGRHAWIPGLAIGMTVAVGHVVALAFRLPEPRMYLPAGWWSTTSLLVLAIPALAAACGGAWIRRIVVKSRTVAG